MGGGGGQDRDGWLRGGLSNLEQLSVKTESIFLSRVEGRGFHVEREGAMSRVTFYFCIFFLEKVIIDAINVIKTNK